MLRNCAEYQNICRRLCELRKFRKRPKAGYKFENEINLSVISDDVAEADSAPEKDCGQLLFAAVNFCRRAGVDPELALASYTESFTDEFEKFENGEN